MSKLVFTGAAIAIFVGSSATAQFRLDYTPSSQRAQYQATLDAQKLQRDKIDQNRLNPLSPLGGAQGTPQLYKPAAPVGTIGSYAGTPSASAPGVGVNAVKPIDTTVDDPNRPREVLRPNALKSGIQPRP